MAVNTGPSRKKKTSGHNKVVPTVAVPRKPLKGGTTSGKSIGKIHVGERWTWKGGNAIVSGGSSAAVTNAAPKAHPVRIPRS